MSVSGPAILDGEVASLDPSQLPQAVFERAHARLCLRVAGGKTHQHPNPPHPLQLLRARGKWPRCCAAEDPDEIAASHVRRTRQPPLTIAQHRATAAPMPALSMGRGDSPAAGPSPG